MGPGDGLRAQPEAHRRAAREPDRPPARPHLPGHRRHGRAAGRGRLDHPVLLPRRSPRADPRRRPGRRLPPHPPRRVPRRRPPAARRPDRPGLRRPARAHARAAGAQLDPRFSACVERLFKAFVDEAKYRAAGVVPAFASHNKIRQITVGLHTGFLLGELTEHIFLPPDVLEHESVRALERTASTIVGFANDIYTVEKERAKGEVNNTVLVLMHEDGLSFDAALARTVQLHNIEMREFERLVADLPSFDEDIDEQLRRYVQVLIHFIAGHDDWARSTGRYHPGEDGAVR
ncbi:terpene synthase family protein [Nannocystis pusilla]|uniref:terpene synthase family protein n=1 Tax=Nannocystis pusilla TaxID=889268 RepID=UPI003B778707